MRCMIRARVVLLSTSHRCCDLTQRASVSMRKCADWVNLKFVYSYTFDLVPHNASRFTCAILKAYKTCTKSPIAKNAMPFTHAISNRNPLNLRCIDRPNGNQCSQCLFYCKPQHNTVRTLFDSGCSFTRRPLNKSHRSGNYIGSP